MPTEPPNDQPAPAPPPPPVSLPQTPPLRPEPPPPPPPMAAPPPPPPPVVPAWTPPQPAGTAAPGQVPPPGTPQWGQPPPPNPWAQAPPAQQGWGQATSPTPLQRVAGIATATKIALAIMTLLSAISVALEINYASKIDGFFNGDGSFIEALDAENTRGGFSTVFIIATLVTAVLWVVWIQRTRANAIALGAGGQRQSDGMAVGGWFIPLANVVLGRLVINDLWRANDPEVPSGYRTEGRPVAGIVSAWWVLWMIGWYVSRAVVAAADSAFDDFDVQAAIDLVRVNAVIEAGFIVAGVLAILIVQQVTERQRQRAAMFGMTLD